MVKVMTIKSSGQGLYPITTEINRVVTDAAIEEGICHILVQHTSASLTIQENADPSAKYDLEQFLKRLVPEGDPHYTHRLEGRDDMPAHIRAALTSTSLSVPVLGGRLALGTWQGIYLWEHRYRPQQRQLVIYVGG
ncbi:YjbQ family protein [Ectothiorhodospiraceae bacterium BW-2]|nr:YjbQ family protein [Ectothiorhodospiraceae bacterium BW-2]